MVHTKHERTQTEDEDGMMIDEVLIPHRQEKRQKKKQLTNRPPLCTFFNYLGPTTTTAAAAAAANDNKNVNCDTTNATTNETDLIKKKKKNTPPSPPAPGVGDAMDIVQEDEELPLETASASGGVSSELKRLSLADCNAAAGSGGGGDGSLADDCASTTSVETVSTSNKSVDAMVRDNRFNFDTALPAVDRWKEPPPPPPPPPQKDDTNTEYLDGEALYVASRCDSDTDSEEDEEGRHHRRPREIVIRKRGRWRQKRNQINRYQNHNKAVPKLYQI